MFHTPSVDPDMSYLSNKLHVPIAHGSFTFAIKPKLKFNAAAIWSLTFHQNAKTTCIF